MKHAALSQPSWALKLVYMKGALLHHHHHLQLHFPHLHSPEGSRDPERPWELAVAAEAYWGRRSNLY